jgi:integrase
MPKIARPMNALEVKRLSEPKLHMVGTVAGLGLSVSVTGARSWILRTTIGARRSDVGLGAYPQVTLAAAHEAARQTLQQIRQGIDPVATRRAKKAVVEWTFKRCAEAYMDAHEAGWKNKKHAQQWRSTLETYVYPHFGDVHVSAVGIQNVTAALRPDWTTKNETMNRVRNRIETVLDWATTNEYRPKGDNPAKWKGNLSIILPKPSKVNKRKSFEALPVDDVASFVARLRGVEGMSARALEFVVLTACRSGEVRGALWSEIDMEKAVWTIPAERMKAGREHRVPLSPAAKSLLESIPQFEGVDLVFPGRDGALSDMSLTAVMRRMKLTAVPHGFRSTFTDWCIDRTAHQSEVREMALAHVIANKTEAAYRRGDLFEKRRIMMNDWAAFVGSTPSPNASPGKGSSDG